MQIVMGRGELKAYLFNAINHMDDASYAGFCDIILTAFGVVDADGNLTPEYAESPYWSVSAGELTPSPSLEEIQKVIDRLEK